MKFTTTCFTFAAVAVLQFCTYAQTNSPAPHVNAAIFPVPRTGSITNRQALVLQRAKDAPGNYDIEFIGDSITQGWEFKGSNVWNEFYGQRKVINANNSNKNKDGTDTYTDADILEGVTAIVNQIRARQPDTKILLLGIFPRAKTFSPQRGRLLEINQALAKLDDGQHICYLDFGSQYIEKDGSISKDIMPDALHPNEAGYKIWANAMEPKLKGWLAN